MRRIHGSGQFKVCLHAAHTCQVSSESVHMQHIHVRLVQSLVTCGTYMDQVSSKSFNMWCIHMGQVSSDSVHMWCTHESGQFRVCSHMVHTQVWLVQSMFSLCAYMSQVSSESVHLWCIHESGQQSVQMWCIHESGQFRVCSHMVQAWVWLVQSLFTCGAYMSQVSLESVHIWCIHGSGQFRVCSHMVHTWVRLVQSLFTCGQVMSKFLH